MTVLRRTSRFPQNRGGNADRCSAGQVHPGSADRRAQLGSMHERDGDLDLRVGTTESGREGLHRIVDSAVLGRSESVTRHRHGLLTGLSMVVVAAEPVASAQVAAVTDWAPPEYRVEFVLAEPSPTLTDRLDSLAWSWVSVASADDPGTALDLATAQSNGEFVVIAGAHAVDATSAAAVRHLGEALGLLWVNGADALVIGPSESVPSAQKLTAAVHGPTGPDVRSDRLAAAIGLRRGGVNQLVVLRRWVARFLFEGIGAAIDPLDEFADRVRVLELRLLEVLGEL